MSDQLDFTANDLLNELAKQFQAEERQPSDVDRQQIAEKLGIAYSTVRLHMQKLIKLGTWDEVLIKENGKHKFVYRKKVNNGE